MSDYTISYSNGWPDWYVSEFYKAFHKKLEEFTKIKFEYIEIRELNKQYGIETKISSESAFSYYSLIIRCNKNGKLFIHSWFDISPATLQWCENKNLNVVLFSGVSNITKSFCESRNNVQPSIYCFDRWSDYELIEQIYKQSSSKISRAYFAGLSYGIRVELMNAFSKHPFFSIHDKSNTPIKKEEYYNEISKSVFGLSFNGAANICYRDPELFGLRTVNLRQPLNCLTYEPLIPGVHYYNFLDRTFITNVINCYNQGDVTGEELTKEINDKVQRLEEFANTKSYNDMISESREWYERNCIPENQIKILYSFLKDLSIFE